MSITPSTCIEHTSLHTINGPDDDDETYQVEILYLADGTVIGYRLEQDDAGRFTFAPLPNGLAEDIAIMSQSIAAR